METRIFSILCENEPGVMMRVSRSFTRRQINIDSITVGIEPSGLARMVLMFKADAQLAEFMRKIITRLTPVVSVEMLDPKRSIAREVALLKTHRLNEKKRGEILAQIEKVGGRVLEVKNGALIVEVYGSHDHIEEILKMLGPNVMRQVARSGQVLISRE